MLGVGAGLASASANATGSYLVQAATEAGTSPGTAGTALALGGLVGICSRVVAAASASPDPRRRLATVSVLVAGAAGGYAALAIAQHGPVLLLGTLLAYVAGWGWNGLFIHAVVGLYPDHPASSTGVSQAGAFMGSVVGPPLFGVVSQATSYRVAWTATALLSLASAAVIARARGPAPLRSPRVGAVDR